MASKVLSIGNDGEDFFVLYHVKPIVDLCENKYNIVVKMFNKSGVLTDYAEIPAAFSDKISADVFLQKLINNSVTPTILRKNYSSSDMTEFLTTPDEIIS